MRTPVANVDAAWLHMDHPTNLMVVTGLMVLDAPMSISADGCVLYLSSDRAGGAGGFDIWQAQRSR